jgi:hypothetical protein
MEANKMTNLTNVKTALISFLEGETTLLDNGIISGETITYKAIDHSRDDAETILYIENHNGLYSVDMLILGSFRPIGGFEL